MSSKTFYTNLHTHTPHCRHASGSGSDFCRQLPESVRSIGFSDHMPFPDGRYSHSSMNYSQLPDYISYIEETRKAFPEIKIFSGLEAEWCPELGRDFYEEHYFAAGIQYLIGSPHYSTVNGAHFFSYDTSDLETVKGFVTRALWTMESGLFLFIAHPDAYLYPFRRLPDNLKSGFLDIVQAAKELDIPLELNCNGLRRGLQYPSMKFWELAAEYGCRTVISSDAHSPGALYDEGWFKGIKMLETLGITPCNEELVQELS